MRRRRGACIWMSLALWTAMGALSFGQQSGPENTVDVHVRVRPPMTRQHEHAPNAVVWLQPLPGTEKRAFVPSGHYTLLQKNRMFTPHLLVIPVGSQVLFPNADPFFHNVFSLFNGRRFDLGLYEAGSTKAETFSREGVSYLFCNIHPEMSAVIVVLSTPLYATDAEGGVYSIRNVPPGQYEMHVWIEGLAQPALDHLQRRVNISQDNADLGTVDASTSPLQPAQHLNKFGQPYDRDSKPAY